MAYFLEWPTANQVAQVDKTYDKELGVEVEWRAFGNGNEMTQAMVSGDVDIAYSQGFVPFVVGVTNGAPLKLVGIAVSYSENDLCIVRDDAGITKDNAKELEGKKVATPTGNVTHYKLLKTLELLGVDASKVEIVQMNGADAAVALVRGDVTMACAFGGPLDRMKTVGKPLMTGAEQEAAGINTFDIISATDSFAKEHPDLLKKFLAVTEASNAAYKADPARGARQDRRGGRHGRAGDPGDDRELRLPDRGGAARAELARRRGAGGGQGRRRRDGGLGQPRQGARRLCALRRSELPEVTAGHPAGAGNRHRPGVHGLCGQRRRRPSMPSTTSR